eukprot:comp17578_c0_seq1/m.17203 comp17578_c0_seq1/g.17203  ORF comp17578_c0_seq1/g.17203 comp17578_c0_seq1/m.17203 type:complete len:115 (-) comp17578_c0_seq1:976-1320(-)
MGLLYLEYLSAQRVYTCSECKCHLANPDDIISKQFHGAYGRAYLFNQVVNVVEGPPEDRVMTTGLHTVMDVLCKRCTTVLGWRYQKAYEASQKYKEGKFILEKALIQEVACNSD